MHAMFDLKDKVAVVTGGTGVLGRAMAEGLAAAGARVALVSRTQEKADRIAGELRQKGYEAIGLSMEVTNREQVEAAAQNLVSEWGRVDLLVNGAGGNNPKATAYGELKFFDLPEDAMKDVINLNILGTVIPSQVFGRLMAEQGNGVIINISSMAAQRPLTRVVGYSSSKSAIDNFTRWLAVHMAQNYSPDIRVNAIAPGFFETEQNRFLLRNDDGSLSDRGSQIIAHTPMKRFGDPDDLVGTLLWLASSASLFVTGIVVPVDGGFSAFSGV